MDVKMRLNVIIDYKEIYGSDHAIPNIVDLIKNIPSKKLLQYISFFNINLYLNDDSLSLNQQQWKNILMLVPRSNTFKINLFTSKFKQYIGTDRWPTVFWGYTNLLFYDLIFQNYNSLEEHDLSIEERDQILDAYLILNLKTRERFNISTEQISNAALINEIESILIPNFIYQNDYKSTTDFSNQVTRCKLFFDYLQTSEIYRPFIDDYYSFLGVRNSYELIYFVMVMFNSLRPDENNVRKSALSIKYEDNTVFLDQLTINNSISSYQPDNSFTTLRNKFLYKPFKNDGVFLLLEINFLIDYLYKSQIFLFKNFIKSKGYRGDFLSIKAKNFMEDIYFRTIMKRCFPSMIQRSGDDVRKAPKDPEIFDYYLRRGSKIAIIEFKDTLLNSEIKNNGGKEVVYKALDLKFIENEDKKPKGLRQLINSIDYIERDGSNIDLFLKENRVDIYPIIVYTDSTFGYDGINKMFSKKFTALLDAKKYKNSIKDITFINLNFFEIRENYLKSDSLDIFLMIEDFILLTSKKDFSTTPFEVFSKKYLNEKFAFHLGNPEFFSEILDLVMEGRA